MKIFDNPDERSWTEILKRPAIQSDNLYDSVGKILEDVKNNGDSAIRKYSLQFDQVEMDQLQATAADLNNAHTLVDPQLQKAIVNARENIEIFHREQVWSNTPVITTPGVKCWQKAVPIEKVGLYIPGGTAPLISTVLMLGIPAKIAGCKEIVLCTPPDAEGKVSPEILFIARLLGIEKVFAVGGVQAIAAMAYGTESVPAVHKIFGPGNQYVTAAKQLVSLDTVAIDMPAGPSELAIIADDSAVPAFVASDLLSQAEHGVDSQVILVSTSEKVLKAVQAELESQLERLPRKEIAAKALENSKLILIGEKEVIIRMINQYAPEHLIIACDNYPDLAERIEHAGSVFLGNFTPESAGDYASGTNHTLPTNGWARVYGGLELDSFMKRISFQEITKSGLRNISDTVMTMAQAEQLDAHKNAVGIRMETAE